MFPFRHFPISPFAPYRSLRVFPDPSAMARFMVGRWGQLAAQAIRNRDRFVVALSGGKTPLLFYEMLAAKKDLHWVGTHLFLVDERFVPTTSDQSNFGTISRTLLQEVPLPAKNIHPIPTRVTDSMIAARLYEGALHRFFRPGPGNMPRFDLIILGIGDDGHTASIFPGGPGLDERQRLAINTLSPKPPHERITLTLPVINHARVVVFLVTGKEKATVLTTVLHQADPALPAAHVKPHDGGLFFLADTEATSGLNLFRITNTG